MDIFIVFAWLVRIVFYAVAFGLPAFLITYYAVMLWYKIQMRKRK